MNTDIITQILKHLLRNSRAANRAVFSSGKFNPLNSIQSIVPSCYVSKIDPTGKGGSPWVAFYQFRPNDIESLIVIQDILRSLSFPLQKTFSYFIIPLKSRPSEHRTVRIFVISFCTIQLSTIRSIHYIKILNPSICSFSFYCFFIYS